MKPIVKKLKPIVLILCIPMVIVSISITAMGRSKKVPNLSGKMVYHSYTSYDAKDSKLYLYDFDSKEKVCLSDNFKNVYNAMNAEFKNDGTEIVFMGMNKTKGYEKWDVYTYNLQTQVVTNLTGKNDLRNEDPKYSSDGKKIVFKQGHWDANKDDMIYDIMELNLENKSLRNITKDTKEDSMPFYSEDDKYVFYARGDNSLSQIYKVDVNNYNNKEKVYSSSGVMAYYPIVKDNALYFTKWYSKSNHTDMIMKMNLETNELESLKFNNKEYNCSDPCPLNDRYMILSSTKGGAGYNLYIADMNKGKILPLDIEYSGINDGGEQLGASCYLESIG
ncbi:PD40 domain-containing protein [Clostridium sp. DSM 8431]|uniref:TolB family protein n=1 Tax=Clostridium sp. DSM 8431 TaxID=1761781 RepID=UPI000B7CFC84|nr:PD40 domain-containing protein [Clostridium sp. DSM 8431]